MRDSDRDDDRDDVYSSDVSDVSDPISLQDVLCPSVSTSTLVRLGLIYQQPFTFDLSGNSQRMIDGVV